MEARSPRWWHMTAVIVLSFGGLVVFVSGAIYRNRCQRKTFVVHLHVELGYGFGYYYKFGLRIEVPVYCVMINVFDKTIANTPSRPTCTHKASYSPNGVSSNSVWVDDLRQA